MNSLKPLFPIALFASVMVAATQWLGIAQDRSEPGAKPALKVLLIDGQNNHDWKSTTPVLKHALESSGRFHVDVSTTPPQDSGEEKWNDWTPEFSAYDAVMSNYNGELWPERVQRAFERFVREGGGFVAVHAADNAFPEWPAYNEMIGVGGWGGRNEKSGPLVYLREGNVIRDDSPGAGGTHGKQWEFNVEIVERNHPITAGLPESWKHTKDELYATLRGPAKNLTVLATAKSETTGRNEPMLMVVSYGKGRVFHTTLGHADYSMRCLGFYTTLQRGTEWVATGKVSLPVPDNFPRAEAAVAVEP